MILRLLWFLLFCLPGSAAVAQVPAISMTLVSSKFQEFAYREVIQLSDQLLEAEALSDTTDLLELRRMRATAFYALSDARAALSECLEILRLDSAYSFDPVRNSPKIISFFDEVKRNMPVADLATSQPPDSSDSGSLLLLEARRQGQREFRSSAIRSIVLPGWGSYHQGKKPRGLAIGAMAVVTAAASIYLWRQTERRQSDYLNETDRMAIPGSYDRYNRSYRQRNVALSLLAAVWIYGQVDIAFFLPEENTSTVQAFVLPRARRLSLNLSVQW